MNDLGTQMLEVQLDLIMVWPRTSAFADLDGHGATDDVARSQILCIRRVTLHEALAL